MKKQCVDFSDIFELNLSIAKALSLLLESDDKEMINDIPLD